jgi:hypothetical protein
MEDTPGAQAERQAGAAAPGPDVAPAGPASGAPPAPGPIGTAEGRPSPPAKPPTLAAAARLLEGGKIDEAIQTLYAVRRRAPREPYAAVLLGHAYFRKQWRTDGLRAYADAIALRASSKRDRTLIRNAVAALDDPTYRRAHWLIRARIGSSAVAELRHTARASHNPRVAQRAKRLADRLDPPRKRHRWGPFRF